MSECMNWCSLVLAARESRIQTVIMIAWYTLVNCNKGRRGCQEKNNNKTTRVEWITAILEFSSKAALGNADSPSAPQGRRAPPSRFFFF